MFCIVVITVVIAYLVFKHKRKRIYDLENHIPGYDDAYPFIGSALKFSGDSEQIMQSMKDLSYNAMKYKHGSFKAWLGPYLYIAMVNPVDIEVILKQCLEKDDLHRFMRRLIGNGVVFAPVSIWKRRRKVIVPAFTPKIVESFVEVFSEQSQVLVKQLSKKADTGFFNVWRFISSYTLDSVSETVMGTKIEAQVNTRSKFLDSMDVILNIISLRIFHLWLQPEWLFRFSRHFFHHETCINVLCQFTDGVIRKKRKDIKTKMERKTESDRGYDSSGSRQTFLDLLISLSEKEMGYTDQELREEVLTLTVAGTDTSAVAVSFTLLLLGKHQDVQENAYQEILDVFGYSDRPIAKEDLSKLQHLDRIIRESLRLYPPVPFITRKVEQEVALPSGLKLPAGAGVVVSIWGVHRNKEYWGPNADEFDPDRFLPERYKLAHPCAFMPFSMGPRNCLGYQYAMLSAKTALASILRRYKVLLRPEQMKSDSFRVKLNIMLKSIHGYEIALERRD